MIAMAAAAGSRCGTSPRRGTTIEGRPAGMGETRDTPRSVMPPNAEARIPPATTIRGAGRRGHARLRPTRTASETSERTTVVPSTSESARAAARSSGTKPCPWSVSCAPSSLGTCPTATVRPTLALMPVSVAWLMFSTSEPRRRSLAATRITPTSTVRVARARILASESPAPSIVERPTSEVATSVAMVEVVDMLSARDPPRAA